MKSQIWVNDPFKSSRRGGSFTAVERLLLEQLRQQGLAQVTGRQEQAEVEAEEEEKQKGEEEEEEEAAALLLTCSKQRWRNKGHSAPIERAGLQTGRLISDSTRGPGTV